MYLLDLYCVLRRLATSSIVPPTRRRIGDVVRTASMEHAADTADAPIDRCFLSPTENSFIPVCQ